MAVDAGTLIRLGSGVLFLGLGGAVAWLGRARVGAVMLGSHLIVAGAYVVIANLIGGVPPHPIAQPLTLAIGALGLAAALLLPERPRRSELWTLLVAAAIASVPPIVYYSSTPEALARLGGEMGPAAAAEQVLGTTSNFLARATFLVASMRLLARPTLDRKRALQAAGVALPTALWLTTGVVDVVGWGVFDWRSFAVAIGFVGPIALAWLIAASRGGGASAVVVAWAFLATMLVTYALTAFAPSRVGGDAFGSTGLLRIFGWTACAYAVLRANLLGVRLPQLAVRRGHLITAVLAGFFVVAQVVENFLDARLGLLTGGLVAGAMLFAASPIQRAMERLADPHATPRGRAGSTGSAEERGLAEREEAYRKAVRLASRDRRLTREEETHLHEIAEQLGLGGRRAHAILSEVEREVGGDGS